MWTVLEETEELRRIEVAAYESKSRRYKHQRAKALAALDSVFAKVWQTTVVDLHFKAWAELAIKARRLNARVEGLLGKKEGVLVTKCFYGWLSELKEKRNARNIRISTFLKVNVKQQKGKVSSRGRGAGA